MTSLPTGISRDIQIVSMRLEDYARAVEDFHGWLAPGLLIGGFMVNRTPRLAAMNKHWKTAPPVHISLARLNSALLQEQTAPETDTKKGMGDFVADFMAAGGGNIAGA